MNHFFAKPPNIDLNQKIIYIDGEDVKHIQKALRLKEKDKITVSDGAGEGYFAEITEMANDQVAVKIIEALPSAEKTRPFLTLYQGIAKGSKMDFIIQKAVELGVSEIIPIMTEHTVVQLKDKEFEKKRQRWQKIAEEAAKQSKRLTLPIVKAPIGFKEAVLNAVDDQSDYLQLLAYEAESNISIRNVTGNGSLTDYVRIGVWIGPEGGFHQEEVDFAIKSDIHCVTLGPRILRTETAGVVMLSILLYELEL